MNNPFTSQHLLSIVQQTLINVMGCTLDELAPDVALSNDLDADSLDFVDLRYSLEKQLALLLPQKSVLDHLEEQLGDPNLVIQGGKITPLACLLYTSLPIGEINAGKSFEQLLPLPRGRLGGGGFETGVKRGNVPALN